MIKQNKYWTGMITLEKEPNQPTPPFKGAGWKAIFASQRQASPHVCRGKEIVIYASSWTSAQRALELIHGCHQLILGEPTVFSINPIAHNINEPKWMESEQRKAQVKKKWSTLDFPFACAVAAKASRRRQWFYSVAKYSFSLSLYSAFNVDMEPWSAPHLAVSTFPSDHVLFSHAIISAYSIVEDLKLSVQASSKNPSRIDREWNPQVKNDLEDRLIKAEVDLDETIVWITRGPKRKIEKKRQLPYGTKAPWSAWIVRDSEIPIIDAIAYAEWLRSRVASHGVNSLTSALSPYDVANVQHLARRLLLNSLGFWHYLVSRYRI